MNNPKIEKLLTKQMTRRQFLWASLLAVVGVIGISSLLRQIKPKANTSTTTSLEAESGNAANGATTMTDGTASGGGAIKFGIVVGNSRDSLVLGQYKPSGTTTGIIPGVPLTTVNTVTIYNSIIGTASSPHIIQNMKFMNLVKVEKCKYVTFKNCSFYGNPPNTPIQPAIISTSGDNQNIVFQDCLITCQAPTTEIQVGVQGGHNTTFLRCEFKGIADSIALVHSFPKNTDTVWENMNNSHDGPMNLTVHGCYFHSQAYFSPEPTRAPADNASHSDLIQIRGGSEVILRYNTFVARLDPSIGAANQPSVDIFEADGVTRKQHISGNKYYPDMNGTSVLMVSPYLAPFKNIYVENNWIDGGAISLNLAYLGTDPGADKNFVVRNNKWGRSMRAGPTATLVALTRFANSGELINTGNTYEDNGAPANFRVNGGA